MCRALYQLNLVKVSEVGMNCPCTLLTACVHKDAFAFVLSPLPIVGHLLPDHARARRYPRACRQYWSSLTPTRDLTKNAPSLLIQ